MGDWLMCDGRDRDWTLLDGVMGILDSLPIFRWELSQWDFRWRKDLEGIPRLNIVEIAEGSLPSHRFVTEMEILGNIHS